MIMAENVRASSTGCPMRGDQCRRIHFERSLCVSCHVCGRLNPGDEMPVTEKQAANLLAWISFRVRKNLIE